MELVCCNNKVMLNLEHILADDRPSLGLAEKCQRIRVQVRCCFTSTETIRTIRIGEPRTSTSTFTQLLISDCQCSFTSTETIRDGEPRTATSTFTQLLSSVTGSSSSMLLYVHRDQP